MRTISALAQARTLRHAVTSLAARARVERAGDLTLSQVAVLGRIAAHGPVTPREICGQLSMLPQSLTRVLAALEADGLVSRTPHPTDGRGALLHVTDSGLTALSAEMAPRDRWMAEAMAAVCRDEDREVLMRACEVMRRLVDFGDGVAPREL